MQVTDISKIQTQNERVQLAQRLYAPDATAEEKRLANRAIAQLLQDCQPTIRYFQRQFSSLDPAAAYSAILDAFNFAIRTYQGGIAQFKTWLSMKVRYKLLDLCRIRQADLVDIAALIDNGFDVFSSTPTPDSPERERVREAIATLPEDTQRIIALSTQGYSWAEIGQIVGKNPDTARMDRHRAILFLREVLGIEPKAPQKKKAVPVISWMHRLWNRFQKSVRVGVSSDDIKAVRLSPQKFNPFPLKWCLGQSSNTSHSNGLGEYCQSLLAFCRGVANAQQAPPQPSIKFLSL